MRIYLSNPEGLQASIIFFIAIALRYPGLTWGLPSDSLPFAPYHPDEVFSISNLSAFKFLEGEIVTRAYREGNFAYYIWALFSYILYVLNFLPVLPHQLSGAGSDMASVIFVSRMINIVIDAGSAVLVFFVIRKISGYKLGAFVGGATFAIIPFEVIYSIYMRPHTTASFFVLLCIFVSLDIYRKNHIKTYFFAGALTAIATSTRYTALSVAGIPMLFYLWNKILYLYPKRLVLRKWMTGIFEKRIMFFVVTMMVVFIGLNLGFLLQKDAVLRYISEQASFADPTQFLGAALFDLRPLWVVLSYLLPYGTLPWLWVLLYGSFLYILFLRRFWRYTLPLAFMFSAYFFLMAKSYPLGFIRTVLPVMFPVFAIFVGLAIGELFHKWGWKSFRGAVVIIFLLTVMLPSVAYDIAYVKGMAGKDPRMQAYLFFQDKVSNKSPIRLGVLDMGYAYFAGLPALILLKDKGLEIAIVGKSEANRAEMDYYLISVMDTFLVPEAKAIMAKLIASGDFEEEAVFINPITLFGWNFVFSRNPHDLLYPFPSLFLLKKI